MNQTSLAAYIIATRAALRARRIIATIEARRTTVATWREQDACEPMADTMRSPSFVKEQA